MTRTFALCTTALVTFAGAAPAFALDPQRVAEAYLGEGYDYVEVYSGPTQTKVEAIRGDREVEVVYDSDGAIVARETDAADPDERSRRGVEINRVAQDFLGAEDDRSGLSGDDDEDDDDGDDGYDDDDDDDDRDEDDDGRDDDDDGRGDDDEDDDDDHDDDHGGDDDSGSDDSGEDGSGGDDDDD